MAGASGRGDGIGPRVLQVLDFAGARAPELQALRELAHDARVLTPADEKLQTQKNQRRRRANAFNSYSMPRRLKQRGYRVGRDNRQQKSEAKVDGETAEKRCRAHERRPHTLLAQRTWAAAPDVGKSVLLPTHVWHAKRMKMQDKYGIVMAEKRADKSVSAALEGLRKTAVVHDTSYYGVLELFGLPQLLLEVLQLISDPEGSDFHGIRFLSGGEEGESVLYHAGNFPNGAICPVTFMWRPVGRDWIEQTDGSVKFELQDGWDTTKRQLWLWIHPSAFMEAATAIATACREVVSEGEEVEIRDRRGHLCRFKVRGRRASELVASLCEKKCAVDTSSAELGTSTQLREEEAAELDHDDGFHASSVIEACAGANRLTLLNAARCSVPSHETAAAIYTVAVADPRSDSTERSLKPLDTGVDTFSLMKEPPLSAVGRVGVNEIISPLTGDSLSSIGKRAEEPELVYILRELSKVLSWTTKSQAEDSSKYPYTAPNFPRDNSMDAGTGSDNGDEIRKRVKPCSWLWSVSKRDALHRNFRKDHELNAEVFRQRKNAKGLLSSSAPAKRIDCNEAGAPPDSLLHLLAIRQAAPFPDTSGWDLVCSPSMALVLLKALVFRGGMVVGTEEDAAISTVLHKPCFPRDFPDTKASQKYWQETAEQLQEEHERKPKAKRFAYDKLGVLSPFEPKWSALFPEDDIRVTEVDASMVEEEPLQKAAYRGVCVLRGASYMKPFCFYPEPPSVATTQFIPVAVPTLVGVIVSVVGRGNLCPNTMLYEPSKDDLGKLQLDSKWRGSPVVHTEQRQLIGYITSAIYDRPKAAFRAVGFCSCEPLQRLFLEQTSGSGSSDAFALARPPKGKMLRPVRIKICLN